MALLKRMVQNERYFFDVVRKADNENKDLQSFVQFCVGGSDEQQIRKIDNVELHALRTTLPVPSSVDNFSFGEREALGLIALSAHELSDIQPFQDHPANTDPPVADAGTTSTRIRRLLQWQAS